MIFLIFIVIPIIEISIFITVGSSIGILNTIAIILFTALVGIFPGTNQARPGLATPGYEYTLIRYPDSSSQVGGKEGTTH